MVTIGNWHSIFFGECLNFTKIAQDPSQHFFELWEWFTWNAHRYHHYPIRFPILRHSLLKKYPRMSSGGKMWMTSVGHPKDQWTTIVDGFKCFKCLPVFDPRTIEWPCAADVAAAAATVFQLPGSLLVVAPLLGHVKIHRVRQSAILSN